jgi:hypothetical protein
MATRKGTNNDKNDLQNITGPRWLNELGSWITFSYIMATSFSGGGSRSTRREPPTLGKQLVNVITCDCESSAPFFVIHKAGHTKSVVRSHKSKIPKV